MRERTNYMVSTTVRTGERTSLFALVFSCFLCVLMMFSPGAHAQASGNNPRARSDRSDPLKKSVKKGVDFLVSKQRKDGSIRDTNGNETAMTSFALLGMLAVGHQPADPTKEGRTMNKALKFVLRDDRQKKNGYFGKADGSRMYGHGVTTLMLSEVVGKGVSEKQDRKIREATRKAVRLILKSQRGNGKARGGWRYSPGGNDADMSVTVWQLMALRSAQNAGFDVPKQAIKEAVGYLRRSYHKKGENIGGFGYQPNKRKNKARSVRYACVGAGLLSLQVTGHYEDRRVKAAANWLRKHEPNWNSKWFLYGTYYYSQGMYQVGGEHADYAWQRVRSILLEHQKKDGSWRGGRSHEKKSRVYATSLALLALSVKYHYLPIYQR